MGVIDYLCGFGFGDVLGKYFVYCFFSGMYCQYNSGGLFVVYVKEGFQYFDDEIYGGVVVV